MTTLVIAWLLASVLFTLAFVANRMVWRSMRQRRARVEAVRRLVVE